MLAEIGASENVTKMMFLAICYSANVGGTGTLIGGNLTFSNELERIYIAGTPPNLIMYDFLSEFPAQPVNKIPPR